MMMINKELEVTRYCAVHIHLCTLHEVKEFQREKYIGHLLYFSFQMLPLFGLFLFATIWREIEMVSKIKILRQMEMERGEAIYSCVR
jgi:hypothetical protein